MNGRQKNVHTNAFFLHLILGDFKQILSLQIRGFAELSLRLGGYIAMFLWILTKLAWQCNGLPNPWVGLGWETIQVKSFKDWVLYFVSVLPLRGQQAIRDQTWYRFHIQEERGCVWGSIVDECTAWAGWVHWGWWMLKVHYWTTAVCWKGKSNSTYHITPIQTTQRFPKAFTGSLFVLCSDLTISWQWHWKWQWQRRGIDKDKDNDT